MAALATWAGADRWRSPLDARKHVTETVNLALADGNSSPAVLDNLRRHRAELGRRPLDSKSRVRYATLLLTMTHSLEDTRAAAFHARAAVALSPVTFPVVELATLILARSGNQDEALATVRSAFEFDPTAAADLLLLLEDSLTTRAPEDGLADRASAWIAWSRVLARTGRGDEAHRLLLDAQQRWPEDLPLLVSLSRVAARREDWVSLEEWTGRIDPIPLSSYGLELLGYRARAHVEYGRMDQAEADLDVLLSQGAGSPYSLRLAGDVQSRMGLNKLARQTWNRALFLLPSERVATRIAILDALATLEESEGRASVALRHWRAILEVRPDHPHARRRVAELSGFAP